jgi:hypothetical protein
VQYIIEQARVVYPGELDASLSKQKTNKIPDRALAKEVLDALDADKSGTLEQDEFVGWLMTGLYQTRDTLEHFSARGHQYKVLHNFLASVVAAIQPNLDSSKIDETSNANYTKKNDVQNNETKQNRDLSALKPDLKGLVNDGVISYDDAIKMMNEEEEANNAAAKIQALQRGKAAREELQNKKDAAVKIQALQRGNADREKVKKMKE